MTTFAALGVDADLVAVLNADGIREPFPIQAVTIADALTGRDLCGKAKTGSGKTLAFGLPMLMRCPPSEPGHPTALVLVPTRELAVQVAGVLLPLAKAVGRTARTFYGGTSLEKDLKALGERVDVAICTPGRLIDLCQQEAVDLDAVAVIVLDEADRMADMGFMPQVEWLLRRVTAPHQTLLFSATLDGDVDHLVTRYQVDPIRHEIVSDITTVTEMKHRFLSIHQMDKPKVVASIGSGGKRTLVFTRTKRGADRLVEQLDREGVRAGAI
ncbi:MAG TPA: DEAD/DEAH box helicase, partial [Acidimicrobiales bacterium]|nr:DEAD/DEAH box helicase [Acidimicrobiales bacterium]